MNRILLVLVAIFAMACTHQRPTDNPYYTANVQDEDPEIPWPDGHPWPR